VILLTGANGHLGANLLRRLLREGEEVRVFLRPESDNRSVQGLPVDRVYGDLRKEDTVDAAVRDCTQIYHVAAKVFTLHSQHSELYECNVIGTRNLLQAAIKAGVSKVVVSGSLSAVGHDPSRPCDETIPFHPFQGQLPYSITKSFVEHECLKAAVEGLQVVVAVSCAILGPWDFKPSRMGKLLVDFSHGRLAAYIPGGCEFVSARDIVEGHILAMRQGRSGQKYIFATQFLTVDQLMGIFEQVTGRRRPRLRVPGALMERLARVLSPAMTFLRPGSPQRFTPAAVRILRMQRRACCAKARQELGFESTSIVDAVQSAYDWFVERGLINRPTLEMRGEPMNSPGP
jgi:nucleoside-diphosphate-sugar epimerase